MKKTESSVLTILFLFSLILASCSEMLPETTRSEIQDTTSSHLKLRLTGSTSTKSSICPDENHINEIFIMVYRDEDGKLIHTRSGISAEEIDIELTSGKYNIYVTANMGDLQAPENEAEINEVKHIIGSFSDMEKGLPMCWNGTVDINSGETATVYANLSRLVSKVGLKVEMGVLDGLEINSVRLYQGAGIIRPFMEGGSRILKTTEAKNGDYATEDDLNRLMAGEVMNFYVVENCQGTLLPYNTDPWNKVPVIIGPRYQLCTYLEMKGRWRDGADYEGNVTYRFFLGEDAEKNFDIRRNSLHDLTLYLDEDSLDKINWKIDTSQMGPTKWDASADLDNNFHKNGEFYVTENISIDLNLDERGQKYWKRRDNAFTLAGIDGNGNTIISFDTPVDCGNGKFQALGTCIAQGRYDIVMMDARKGKVVYSLRSGTVHLPEIKAEQTGRFLINGSQCDIKLYLTDKDGNNLNQSAYYGCDLSRCDWDMDIVNEVRNYELNKNITIDAIPGTTGSDSYAVCYRLGFLNDGKDAEWNRKLTESLGEDKLRIRFKDNGSGATGNHPAGLFCDDIELTFMPVPDNMTSLIETEFMYMTENPSNLPIKIRGLKLNSMKVIPSQEDMRPILCEAISGHASTDPLLITSMPYTICSKEQGTIFYSSNDGKAVYPAADLDFDQSAVPYQKALFHTFDAELAYDSSWTPGFTGKIDFYSSQAHSTLYGENGYCNCGIVLYTDRGQQELFDIQNNAYGKFDRYGEILSRKSVERFNETVEVDITINENNEIVATASEDIELNVSISGTLRGHIRCVTVQDPLYTIWGHYFKYSQEFSNSGRYKIGSLPSMIDSGALIEAFAQMRSIPYYSLLDAWNVSDFTDPYTMTGTVREYLKPYGMDLKIEMTAADGTPVAVRFSGISKYRYTQSDPVTWTIGILSHVTMVPSSHSGFDSRLDDDDCPPGDLFKEETVTIRPNVSYVNRRNIFHLCR